MRQGLRLLAAALLLLCASRAEAGTITIAWDPNTETDLAGYVVAYGMSSGLYDVVVDVGLQTTWTLPDAVAGRTYYFVVRAYNSGGLQSASSLEVSGMASGSTPGGGPAPVPTPATRVSVNRTALNFGGTTNGAVRTGAQTVTVGFTSGAATWSVSSNVPWATVNPASGAGAGSFEVTVNPGAQPAGTVLTGTLTVSAPGVTNSPVTVPVQFTSVAAPSSPFGNVDAPADNAQGISGALAVGGWAVDDIGVSQVTVWRDPVPGEAATANGLVFIGRTVSVDGARPDVDAAYALPYDYKAGWGYLILTNMLPNQGNGTFRLSLYADDIDGHSVLLGTRTFTCDNAHATRPFGTIDTPEQGGTVWGTYTNFGWALTPQPNVIPADGSTITVFIDGVPVGHPAYNFNRTDIQSLFPGLRNTNGALGYFQFDSTLLANGTHTIAWGVSDSAGNLTGMGSRYFTVLNSTSSSTLSSLTAAGASAARTIATEPAHQSASAAGSLVGSPVSSLETAPIAAEPSYVQSGFDRNAPLEIIDRVGDAPPTVTTAEMGLVRVIVGPPVSGEGDEYEGYLVQGGQLEALPSGSMLDYRSGEFYWQPGVGFAGSYDFVFLRTADGFRQRILLRVEIR